MNAAKEKKEAPPLLLTNGSPGEPTHDEIALRAYSLWEQLGGNPSGAELASRRQSSSRREEALI